VTSTDRTAQRGRQGATPRALADVELLAWLLDNSVPIPGTGRRIGLDGVVGLVPGLGDVISAGLGIFVVLRGLQVGLPRVVVARMLINLGLDVTIGAIPIIGDAFDLWFKSNARNLGLIQRHAGDPGASTRGDWAFVWAVVAGAIALLLAVGWLVGSLIGWLISLL
jgi:Domain of unknown function (DUF4112)